MNRYHISGSCIDVKQTKDKVVNIICCCSSTNTNKKPRVETPDMILKRKVSLVIYIYMCVYVLASI